MTRFKQSLLTAMVIMAVLCPGAFAAQHHMSCEVTTPSPVDVGKDASVSLQLKDENGADYSAAWDVEVVVDNNSVITATNLTSASGIDTNTVTGTLNSSGTGTVTVTGNYSGTVTVVAQGDALPGSPGSDVSDTFVYSSIQTSPAPTAWISPTSSTAGAGTAVFTYKISTLSTTGSSDTVVITNPFTGSTPTVTKVEVTGVWEATSGAGLTNTGSRPTSVEEADWDYSTENKTITILLNDSELPKDELFKVTFSIDIPSESGTYAFSSTYDNYVDQGAAAAAATNDGWTVTVNPGAAAYLEVTGTAATMNAGATQALTITARDTEGNVVTSYTGDKTLTFSGPSASPDGNTPTVTSKTAAAVNIGSTTTITFTDGISSAGGTMNLFKAEDVAVDVSDGTIDSTGDAAYDLDVTVSPLTANRLVVTGSDSQTAGGAQTITVTARDNYGNVATTYIGNKDLVFSGPAASPDGDTATVTDTATSAQDIGDPTTLAFTAGISTAGGSMILYKEETVSINVDDGTVDSTGDTAYALEVTVSADSVSRLEITGTAAQTAGGAQTVTVTAKDAYGNINTSYTGDKSLTFSGPSVSADGNTPTVADKSATATDIDSATTITFTSGVSSAGGSMILYKAESVSVDVSDGSIDSTGNNAYDLDVTVSQAAINRLEITGDTSQTAGTANELTITAKDTYGNIDTTYTGDKALTFSGPSASPGGTAPTVSDKTDAAQTVGTATTITFTAGVSSAGGSMVLYKGETVDVEVSDGTISSTGSGNYDLGVTVSPVSASNLAITGTGTQAAGASQSITITATDGFGNVDVAYTGDKSLTFSGPSSSPDGDAPTMTDKGGTDTNFGSSTTVTFSTGVSSAGGSMILYKAETVSVDVSDGTINSSANVAYDLDMTVSPGTASRLVATGTALQIAGGAQSLTITAKDDYGNTATAYTGDKDLIFAGPSASPDSNTPTVSDKDGTATDMGDATTISFTAGISSAGGTLTVYKTEESVSVDVTDGTIDSTGDAAYDLDIAVSPGTAARLEVTGSASQAVGSSQSITVTAKDSYGNVAISYTGDKNLIFSGPSASNDGNNPTVTDKDAAAQNVGSSTTVTFTTGASSAGGAMVLYKVETASVDVTDGTISSTGDDAYDLEVVVTSGSASRLVITGSNAQSAGGNQSITITAMDDYGNTAVSYTGDKSLTFSGPLSSPDGDTPTVTDKTSLPQDIGDSTTVTFTAGVNSAGGSLTLYLAETVELDVGDGSIDSTGTDTYDLNITVSPATAARLEITGSTSKTAGSSQVLNIWAKDAYGNIDTAYTGDKTLTFSGPGSAPDGNNPTVTDKTGILKDFGLATTITFSAGIKSVGGSMLLYLVEDAEIDVSDGNIDSTDDTSYDLDVEVTPASTNRLQVSGSGSQSAGSSQGITITAKDSYGNTTTSYSGDKSLTFSGPAAASDGSKPTVTDKDDTDTDVGDTTVVTFTSGVNSAGGTMTLYLSGLVSVDVTDGTYNSTSAANYDLDVTVSADTASRLEVTGTASQSVGSAQTITIIAKDDYGNIAASYTGDKDLMFAGPDDSPDGDTPTITDKDAVAQDIGDSTTITFSAGTSSVGGSMTVYRAETVEVEVTDSSIDSTGDDAYDLDVTVSPGSASRLVVDGTDASPTAGDSQLLTITATDDYGNPATTYTGDKSLTFSGPSASPDGNNPTVTDKTPSAIAMGTTTTVTFTSGVNSAGGTMVLYKAESVSVDVSDGTINSTGDAAYDFDVVVGQNTASRLVVTGSASQTVGAAQPLTITAADDYGNTVTSYTGDKSLTFSGPADSPDGDTPTVTDKDGTATDVDSATTITFASGVSSAGGSMVLYKAETVSVDVDDGTIDSTGAATYDLDVTVSPDSASSLVVTGSGSQTAGAAQALTVTARDDYGNTATTYTGDKSLTFSGPADSPDGDTATVTDKDSTATDVNSTTTVTFTSGVSSAGGSMVLYKVETVDIDVTDGTLDSTGDAAFDLGVTVSPDTASRLEITAGSGTMTAGNALAITVTAKDAYGNNDTAYTGDVALSFSGPADSPDGDSPTVTDKDAAAQDMGTATTLTFTTGVSSAGGSMVLYTAESVEVEVTDGSISSTGSAGYDLDITVDPDSASRLTVEGTATQQSGVSQTITVSAQDDYGNVDTTYTGLKNLTFSGATASGPPNPSVAGTDFGGATTLTFASGQVTASMILYAAETASVDTDDGTLDSTGDAAYDLDVTVAANHLVITGSAGQIAGSAQALTITAKDYYGSTDTGYTGSKSLTFSGPAASADGDNPTVTDSSSTPVAVGSTTTITFTAGVASAGGSMVLYKTEGAAVDVSDGTIDTTGDAAYDLDVAVIADTASRLEITGSGSQTAGAAQSLTITAKDGYGNTDLTYTGDKTLTFSGPAASPDSDNPTVTDKNPTAVDIGSTTTITFTVGVSSAGGSMVLYKVETVDIDVDDGSINSTGSTDYDLGVSVTADSAARLEVTGTGTQMSGTSQTITVTAKDDYGNIDLTYSGSKNLTFSGASSAGGPPNPTVAATDFGSTTSLTFASGQVTSSMLLYAAESATIDADDGSIDSTGNTSYDLDVTVSANHLVVTGSALQTAGIAQTLTITAKDYYGGTDTGYTGDKSLTFSGPAAAPDGNTPTVTDKTVAAVDIGTTTTVTFTAGVGSAGGSMMLYKAETVSVDATDGTIGTSADAAYDLDVVVSSSTASRLEITGGAVQLAGVSQSLVITAKDTYGNVATGYTGDKSLTFSGPAVSSDGDTPTVTDKGFTLQDLGSATTITFTAGVMSAGGSITLYKVETVSVDVSDGTIDTTGTAAYDLDVVVSAASAARLEVTGSGVQTAGSSQTVTVTAKDSYGNVDLTYIGDKSLTFSGPVTSPDGNSPVVTDKLGSDQTVGTATTMTFIAGISSAGGSMTLYTAETAAVDVSDGSIGSTGAVTYDLDVTVSSDTASRLEVTGTGTQTAGTSQSVTITAKDDYGNTAAGYSGDKSLLFSGPAAAPDGTDPTVTDKVGTATDVGSSTTITFASGVSSAGGSMILYKSETTALDVSDGSINSDAAAAYDLDIIVSPATANQAVISSSVLTLSVGTSGTMTVEIRDEYDNPQPDGEVVVTLSSDSAGSYYFYQTGTTTELTGSQVTVADSVSSGTFDYNDWKEGTSQVTATTSLTVTTDSQSVTVNRGAFTKLQLVLPGETAAAGTSTGKTGTVSDQLAGTSFTVTINAVDAYWNRDSSVTDTVRITSTDPLFETVDVDLAAGTASQSVTLKTRETQTITASDVTQGGKTAHSVDLTITPGALDHFLIAHDEVAVTTVSEAVTVSARDEFGNVIPTYTGTITLGTNTAVSAEHITWYQGSATNAPDNTSGEADEASLLFDTADQGQVTIYIKSTEFEVLNLSVSGDGKTDDDTEENLTFGSAGAYTISLLSTAPSEAPKPLATEEMEVKVKDKYGNVERNAMVSFLVLEGTGTLDADGDMVGNQSSTVTETDGTATAAWTLGAGTNKARATITPVETGGTVMVEFTVLAQNSVTESTVKAGAAETQTVSLADGTALDVPPGAIVSDTTISIEQKYDADVEDEFGNEVPSPHDDDVYLDYLTTDGGKTSDGDTGVPLTFEFLPSGKIFAQPVTFKVPLPEGISAERASKSRLYFWDVVEWVPAGGEVKEIDGRYWIYVELNHFSTYAVVLEETPAPSASGPLITGISLSSNPFTPNNDGLNDRVTIRFGLARASTVNITVYDTGGNVVRTLVEIKEYPAGWLSVQWDGTTRWEGRVTSGNYILEIDASSDDGEQRTETMLLGIVR